MFYLVTFLAMLRTVAQNRHKKSALGAFFYIG